MDAVDLALCLFIYEVCNDVQFGYMSGSDFVNFIRVRQKHDRKRLLCYYHLIITLYCHPSFIDNESVIQKRDK